jgi:hypothetical protein
MKINKFWAKVKMMFVGVGLMSIISFFIFMANRIFEFKISGFIFLIVAIGSALIANYSNYRRMLELEAEK